MVALIGGLLWYVGISSLVATLSQMKLEYFALAFPSLLRYKLAVRPASQASPRKRRIQNILRQNLACPIRGNAHERCHAGTFRLLPDPSLS